MSNPKRHQPSQLVKLLKGNRTAISKRRPKGLAQLTNLAAQQKEISAISAQNLKRIERSSAHLNKVRHLKIGEKVGLKQQNFRKSQQGAPGRRRRIQNRTSLVQGPQGVVVQSRSPSPFQQVVRSTSTNRDNSMSSRGSNGVSNLKFRSVQTRISPRPGIIKRAARRRVSPAKVIQTVAAPPPGVLLASPPPPPPPAGQYIKINNPPRVRMARPLPNEIPSQRIIRSPVIRSPSCSRSRSRGSRLSRLSKLSNPKKMAARNVRISASSKLHESELLTTNTYTFNIDKQGKIIKRKPRHTVDSHQPRLTDLSNLSHKPVSIIDDSEKKFKVALSNCPQVNYQIPTKQRANSPVKLIKRFMSPQHFLHKKKAYAIFNPDKSMVDIRASSKVSGSRRRIKRSSLVKRKAAAHNMSLSSKRSLASSERAQQVLAKYTIEVEKYKRVQDQMTKEIDALKQENSRLRMIMNQRKHLEDQKAVQMRVDLKNARIQLKAFETEILHKDKHAFELHNTLGQFKNEMLRLESAKNQEINLLRNELKQMRMQLSMITAQKEVARSQETAILAQENSDLKIALQSLNILKNKELDETKAIARATLKENRKLKAEIVKVGLEMEELKERNAHLTKSSRVTSSPMVTERTSQASVHTFDANKRNKKMTTVSNKRIPVPPTASGGGGKERSHLSSPRWNPDHSSSSSRKRRQTGPHRGSLSIKETRPTKKGSKRMISSSRSPSLNTANLEPILKHQQRISEPRRTPVKFQSRSQGKGLQSGVIQPQNSSQERRRFSNRMEAYSRVREVSGGGNSHGGVRKTSTSPHSGSHSVNSRQARQRVPGRRIVSNSSSSGRTGIKVPAGARRLHTQAPVRPTVNFRPNNQQQVLFNSAQVLPKPDNTTVKVHPNMVITRPQGPPGLIITPKNPSTGILNRVSQPMNRAPNLAKSVTIIPAQSIIVPKPPENQELANEIGQLRNKINELSEQNKGIKADRDKSNLAILEQTRMLIDQISGKPRSKDQNPKSSNEPSFGEKPSSGGDFSKFAQDSQISQPQSLAKSQNLDFELITYFKMLEKYFKGELPEQQEPTRNDPGFTFGDPKSLPAHRKTHPIPNSKNHKKAKKSKKSQKNHQKDNIFAVRHNESPFAPRTNNPILAPLEIVPHDSSEASEIYRPDGDETSSRRGTRGLPSPRDFNPPPAPKSDSKKHSRKPSHKESQESYSYTHTDQEILSISTKKFNTGVSQANENKSNFSNNGNNQSMTRGRRKPRIYSVDQGGGNNNKNLQGLPSPILGADLRVRPQDKKYKRRDSSYDSDERKRGLEQFNSIYLKKNASEGPDEPSFRKIEKGSSAGKILPAGDRMESSKSQSYERNSRLGKTDPYAYKDQPSERESKQDLLGAPTNSQIIKELSDRLVNLSSENTQKSEHLKELSRELKEYRMQNALRKFQLKNKTKEEEEDGDGEEEKDEGQGNQFAITQSPRFNQKFKEIFGDIGANTRVDHPTETEEDEELSSSSSSDSGVQPRSDLIENSESDPSGDRSESNDYPGERLPSSRRRTDTTSGDGTSSSGNSHNRTPVKTESLDGSSNGSESQNQNPSLQRSQRGAAVKVQNLAVTPGLLSAEGGGSTSSDPVSPYFENNQVQVVQSTPEHRKDHIKESMELIVETIEEDDYTEYDASTVKK